MTNFYFEGRKAANRKAKFGRSKEKRSDCRLLVLALCINTDGFIRYSAILEGNTADPKPLPAMVDIERVAREHGKYPSISLYYDIDLTMWSKHASAACPPKPRLTSTTNSAIATTHSEK